MAIAGSDKMEKLNECEGLLEQLQSLYQEINKNNYGSAEEINAGGDYVLSIHSVLTQWEGRQILVPRGFFDPIEDNGKILKSMGQSRFENAQVIETLQKESLEAIANCLKQQK